MLPETSPRQAITARRSQWGAIKTTTTITSSTNPSGYGTPITFGSTVTSPNGTPAGTVSFYDGATLLGSGVLSAGQASFQTSSLNAGLHSITAGYDGGNGSFSKSTSAVFTQTVTSLTPVFLSLTSSQSINTGTPTVTLGGKIAAGSLIPAGGTVSIAVNGVSAPATIQNDGTFSATIDTHALAVDSYAVIYSFAAFGNFSGIVDSSTRITVQIVSTTTALSSSANPAVYGSAVTFTATVSSVGVTPTGTVTFLDNGNPLSSPVPLNAGQVNYSTVSLPAGQHSITAAYTSDSGLSGSTSSPVIQTITPLASAFSDLTPSQTVRNSASSINLAGTISSIPAIGSLLQYTDSNTNALGGVVFQYDTTGMTSDSVTFSMWIKTSVQTQQMLFQGFQGLPYIYMQNDQLGVQWNGAGNGWLSADTRPISDGRWHHIAVTFDQGKITFYKDDIATADTLAVDTRSAPGSPINLGGSIAGIPGFAGQMWNGKVWDSVLSAAAIGADMYQTYSSGALPTDLRFLSVFDSNTGLAINRVNGVPAANVTGTITLAALPAYYPAVNEKVSITIGTLTHSATVGASGSFAASFSMSGLATGNYPIQYNYNGNTYLGASTDHSTSLTLQNAGTTTMLSSSALTADYGTPVTFTATVTGPNGTPTGTVTFLDGGNALGAPVTLTAGVATFHTSSLAVGAHSITASYASDSPSFTASTSTAITETINKLTPLFSNLTPSQSIAPGTATVTLGGKIAAGSAIPAGTVSISLNGVITTPTIGGDGSFAATFDTSSLAAGNYPITYAYTASGNFNGATDSSTTLTVKSGSTTTTLTSSALTVNYGTQVTFTATVTSQNGTPTGTVTFLDGSNALGAPATLTAGVATFQTSSLAVGAHSITASYASASPNFTASTSAPITETINKLTPLFSNLTPSQTITAGTATVTLGGKIAAGSAIPNGTASISLNGVIKTPTIGVDGGFSATFDTSTLAAGNYPIAYAYSASGNFNGATDNSTTLTVKSGSTTTAVSSSALTADYGTQVTFTATVSSQNGTPTGTVTFLDGSNALGAPVTLIAGTATFPTSSLAVGAHSITASYASASPSFTASTSAPITETINKLTPLFSNLTPSQTITAGTATVTLGGKIAAGQRDSNRHGVDLAQWRNQDPQHRRRRQLCGDLRQQQPGRRKLPDHLCLFRRRQLQRSHR